MTEFQDKKIIRVIQKNKSLMHLTWMINNICNNKCSYCVPSLNSGKGHHYKWENVKKFLDTLFERYPQIHCSVTGGEPSISPFFPELVKIFNLSGNSIGTTSNAYKSIEYWEDISKYLSYICFSYHPEFPAKNFKEKVLTCSSNTYTTVRIMMLPSQWEHCIEIFNQLKDIDTILIEPVRILDWGGNKESHTYTENQLDWFKSKEASDPHRKMLYHLISKKSVEMYSHFQFDDKSISTSKESNAVQFINSGMTNFKGYVCEIGLKSLFVHHTGQIDLGNCAVGGSIGNIDDPDNIQWPVKRVICTKNICHCATDVNVNKWIRNYKEYIQ
jgi:organic radical activating enzyme